MKNTIKFSKFFLPGAIISSLVVAFGIAGYVTKGFTLGVDFKSGLIQEVQIAPAAFNINWNGVNTSAILSSDRSGMYVVVSGSDIDSQTYPFSYNEYNTIGSLANAMKNQLEDINITVKSREGASSQWLLVQGSVSLNTDSFIVIHYHDPASLPIDISEVRTALAGISGVSVQSIGDIQNRQFMIRSEDKDGVSQTSELLSQALESFFGEGEIAILRSDFVDQRFSALTASTSVKLLLLTLLVILIYLTIRFKPKFALGAVLAIALDGIVVVAFVVWTQMEFSTIIIAAVLTILGYSLNNTIIVFDRVRENLRLYPDNTFTDVVNISLTNVLGRTIITTVTTMLAVLFLFIFAKGSMKDFALALIVGLTSGVYTTLFISTGFVNFLENYSKKNNK
ncbi:MAG: protein translocase subunit SecF [Treponema sp.]|jgi:preprotein translocase subunit SecF|nr:protein translocase subunit SecF [Treponema sp.]